MALNLTTLNAMQPRDRLYKKSDGGGLSILVHPNGRKAWSLSYRLPGGKQKSLPLGTYPNVKPNEARALALEAKQLLSQGTDPSAARKALKSGSKDKTFDQYAADYISERASMKKSPAKSTLDKMEWCRGAVRRQIGGTPITKIKRSEIIDVIRTVEKAGTLHKAAKIRMFVDQVYDYASIKDELELTPPGRIIAKYMDKPEIRNHPGLTDPNKIGELLRAVDGYTGDVSTHYALRLAPHIFLRDGEIRALKWSMLDKKKRIIEIPAFSMKMKRDHIVPLSSQTLALIEEIEKFSGRQDHLFPSPINRGRSISSNTLNVALRRMGFPREEVTFHGFRTTASTRLSDIMKVNKMAYTKRAVELQLSHFTKNKVDAAYDKAELLDEREEMMQIWSDTLDAYRQLPPKTA